MAIFDPNTGLFEGKEGASTLLPVASTKYSKSKLTEYEAIGRVMIKAVLDRVPLPRGISVSLFAYLRNDNITLQHLAEFDPVMRSSLEAIKAIDTQDHLEALCLSFPEDDMLEVTLENRDEFVQAMTDHHTIGCRSGAIKAMVKGLSSIAPLCTALQQLPLTCMHDVVCGASEISAEAVTSHFHIQPGEFGDDGLDFQVHEQLRALMFRWDQQQRQQFLAFTTGVGNLQPDGTMRNHDATPPHKIRLQSCGCPACKQKVVRKNKCSSSASQQEGGCQNLPVASTCFWTLRIPSCETTLELERRFLVAFEWANGSFGEL
eukprot:TRINITY_DN4940_c0_g1_i1.p1 TRINITY_DN4940_c0_g1~~TRINITY_DN4940_c0_g1_i1.p1  ORF type:complete len:318 (-),score=64.26 TRINITY_DN4940_c0_g1_i1:353-1306(-)